MDFNWGIAFFLFGKKVTPVESQGNRTAVKASGSGAAAGCRVG